MTISPSVPRGCLDVVVVEDAHVEVLVVDDAGGLGLVLQAGRQPRDQRCLGEAVAARERADAEPALQDVVDLGRERHRGEQPEGVVRLRGARAGHLRAVDVVGEEVGHRAEQRGDGGAGAVELGPEVRHREPLVDRRPTAPHQRAEHRGGERVVVEQREGGPHHVLRGPPPADADLAGQRLVVVVAQHAALRRAGGAARVDEGPEVRRSDVDGGPVVRRREEARPGAHVGADTGEGGLTRVAAVGLDHDHADEVVEVVDDRGGPLGEAGLDHQDLRRPSPGAGGGGSGPCRRC